MSDFSNWSPTHTEIKTYMNRYFLASALSALLLAMPLSHADDDNLQTQAGQFKKAFELYEHGMYGTARQIFSAIQENKSTAQGYAVLCSIKMKSASYEEEITEYLDQYPYSELISKIKYQYALNLFDESEYVAAAEQFEEVDRFRLDKNDLPEYTFKRAYAEQEAGNDDSAMQGYMRVTKMRSNDYTAPSEYSIGFIYYRHERFTEAMKWFEKSGKDERFKDISSYYIMECRFMNKDYDFVTANAESIFAGVPAERKARTARIISESYLVKGNTAEAKKYYDYVAAGVKGQTRADYFYAGSLFYAVKDWQGAIDNYTRMDDRSDSLGQIANYQLAYSYIEKKNKVAALAAFKDASAVSYNAAIEEDAYFNYAKLSFDLNEDASVFKSYLDKYSDLAKGDRIYSYMALAALHNRDYAGAVEAYDKIETLDKDMTGNYMKANYLRANQLISAGSFRSAVPCLKSAAYYSNTHSGLNQLSRYWLAETYYRDDKFSDAREIFNSLYNISALDNRVEGELLPYNIAYCDFKNEKYDAAIKWFDIYLEKGTTQKSDALTRKGDCYFIGKDYANAVRQYSEAIKSSSDMSDLYPYYQGGLAYSLLDNTSAEISLLSPVKGASPEADFYCDAVYELGRAYMTAGNASEAASCYNKIVSAGKDSTYKARALIGLGTIASNAGNYDEALSYYKKVVSDMPAGDYVNDAMSAIESVYQVKQAPEEYIAYLESLKNSPVKTESDKETIMFNAIEQIYLAGNYQKALVSLKAYDEKFPNGKNRVQADFYFAECYKALGKKDQACDYYRKVVENGEGSFVEISALNFANISYGLQKYSDAYQGYRKLAEVAQIDNNKFTAVEGMANAAYYGKNYANAIVCADKLYSYPASGADDKRHAQYIKAKSCLATSDRAGAFEILKSLSKETSYPEGAEAAYLLIADSYDSGDFTSVENQVYAFAESGSGQDYWLAKSFILLGDSFVENGDLAQAKATFESVRDGYKSQGDGDDVLDNVNMRLAKLAEMMQSSDK